MIVQRIGMRGALAVLLLVLVVSGIPSVSTAALPEQPYLFVYAENDLTPGFELHLTNDSMFSWRRVVFVALSWSNESELLIRYKGTSEIIYQTVFSHQVKFTFIFPGSQIVSFQVIIDDTWWNFTDILIARDMAPPEDIFWDEDPMMSISVREYKWKIVEVHLHHILLSVLGCPLGIYLMKCQKERRIVFKRADGGS